MSNQIIYDLVNRRIYHISNEHDVNLIISKLHTTDIKMLANISEKLQTTLNIKRVLPPPLQSASKLAKALMYNKNKEVVAVWLD